MTYSNNVLLETRGDDASEDLGRGGGVTAVQRRAHPQALHHGCTALSNGPSIPRFGEEDHGETEEGGSDGGGAGASPARKLEALSHDESSLKQHPAPVGREPRG